MIIRFQDPKKRMDATHAPAAPSSLSSRLARVALGLVPCLLAAGLAAAQAPSSNDHHEPPLSRVEVAGFAGLQFGGGVQSASSGRQASFGAGLDYGGTVDVRFAESWSVEALYSRQGTELPGPFDASIERFMVGVTEEHDHGRTKVFGAALLGATRFVPGRGAYGSEVLFTLALGLGVKHFVSDRVALRAEARGFYAITQAGGGLFCSGGCLFVFSSSGLVQGDVTAGVAVAF